MMLPPPYACIAVCIVGAVFGCLEDGLLVAELVEKYARLSMISSKRHELPYSHRLHGRNAIVQENNAPACSRDCRPRHYPAHILT